MYTLCGQCVKKETIGGPETAVLCPDFPRPGGEREAGSGDSAEKMTSYGILMSFSQRLSVKW